MVYYFGDRITADSRDELEAFTNALGLDPMHWTENGMTKHLGADDRSSVMQKAKRLGAIGVAPRTFLTIRNEAI